MIEPNMCDSTIYCVKNSRSECVGEFKGFTDLPDRHQNVNITEEVKYTFQVQGMGLV